MKYYTNQKSRNLMFTYKIKGNDKYMLIIFYFYILLKSVGFY